MTALPPPTPQPANYPRSWPRRNVTGSLYAERRLSEVEQRGGCALGRAPSATNRKSSQRCGREEERVFTSTVKRYLTVNRRSSSRLQLEAASIACRGRRTLPPPPPPPPMPSLLPEEPRHANPCIGNGGLHAPQSGKVFFSTSQLHSQFCLGARNMIGGRQA